MTPVPNNQATVCIDLGGTKILIALVSNGKILDRVERPTRTGASPEEWMADIASVANQWDGQYRHAGIAVTGQISNGLWTAVNRSTLDLSKAFPLEARLAITLGCPAYAVNDAQAAAWGEYRHGTSNGADMVFLTISTGVGGGYIVNGKPAHGRNGLAGHFGQITSDDVQRPGPLEDHISGRWIAAQAQALGHTADASDVFEAAISNQDWAEAIIAESARRAALLCRNIQMMLDPQCIVIGGGIGLASGYLDRLRRCCANLSDYQRPNFTPAKLGRDAGIMGVADLTIENLRSPTGRK